MHDRLCASSGGLKRLGAIAADGGAARTLFVKLFGTVVLAQVGRANLQDRLQTPGVPELFRSFHAVVDLLDQ